MMFINEDIEIDDKSANNKCIDCDNNQQGFCTKKGKWAHLVNCKEDEVIQVAVKSIMPTCVSYRRGKYVSSYFKGGKVKLGTYKTLNQAVKAVSDHEIKTYGERRVNLDWEV